MFTKFTSLPWFTAHVSVMCCFEVKFTFLQPRFACSGKPKFIKVMVESCKTTGNDIYSMVIQFVIELAYRSTT